ncbi:hypothetical protein CYMTET_23561 [Cymbomonas tetramitiformis]|uniref:S-adenosylmethionine-dependent methyltransferase domain-containing protein n=1 Tax=Cymbomonas tetramitiformis TaxID=36881 RepID=A0AAE0FY74_9CHLO|nr:hypothetical protein CYMTET_23561 [Cymbomonas tetramitiformis]
MAAGASVLNAFSFSGGFSVYAARGGATDVTSLDLSKFALASAERNYSLNTQISEVAACRHHVVQADAFKWLAESQNVYDIVILDPPALAKRKADTSQALQAYRKLASSGAKLTGKGGILISASCSAHIKADDFFDMVHAALKASGRKFKELQRTGQPGDHPAIFQESKYLKCIYVRML